MSDVIHWKVLGIQVGTTKKNAAMRVLHLSRETNREALIGEEVKSHFIFGDDLISQVDKLNIGDRVEVFYNQSGFASCVQTYV